MDLDGIVIATPSAMHAEQSIAALERGRAVFCQKPLARTAEETRAVIESARAANRLLGVDFSYRHTDGVRKIRDLIAAGRLGEIFAAELVFHNAYGPDKNWYYDPKLSGGGCLIDLGIHLIDLALWMLDYPTITAVNGDLFSRGERVNRSKVEDYASASLTTATGTAIRIACSWKLPAAADAVISAAFYGTRGGVEFSNVGGSFYDFSAVFVHDRHRITLSSPPDAWGGRALIAWAQQLSRSNEFDPISQRLVDVASVLDAIYGSCR